MTEPPPVESRFEALQASGLTVLVGREEELDLLLRRWSKAENGEGHALGLLAIPTDATSFIWIAVSYPLGLGRLAELSGM